MFGFSKNKRGRYFLKLFFVFFLACGWIFFGGPQFGDFPLKVEKAQAAVSFQAYAVSAQSNGTTGFTMTIPSGVVADQDLYILFSSRDHAAGTALATVSDNDTGGNTWTRIGNSTDRKLNVFWKKATSGTASKTITVAGCVGSCTGGVSVFSGGYPGDPTTNFVVENNASADETHAGFTPSYADSFIVFGVTNPTNDSVLATLLNSANLGTLEPEQWQKGSTGGSDTYAILGGIAQVGAAAATGNFTWAQTDSATNSVSFAIRPLVVTVPTVSTQAASSVESTTTTGNGTIDATGGATVTRRGFCYMVGTSGDPTTADSVAYDDGSFSTGAYTKGLTGLSPGTSYRVRAYAVNSAGTGYGATVQILTKPAAPTNVAATDGTPTDKVTITWTKSTGATDYHVWRDSTDLGAAGDVATFDDTGAGAPSITAGNAIPSYAFDPLLVYLSLSGSSFNNGTTHTYKVVASNATGNSADSATNAGYRGYGTPSYQWQRSAGESDADYSDISGATSANDQDAGAPADGSVRYYRCILSSTAVSQQISVAGAGCRSVISVTLEPGSGTVTYGSVLSSQDTTSSGVNQTQTVRNTGNTEVDIDIKGQHSGSWTLGAAAGDAIYKHEWCTQTCDATPVWNAMTTTYDSDYLATNVFPDSTIDFDLKLTVPTSNAGTNQQNVDVFVRAVQH